MKDSCIAHFRQVHFLHTLFTNTAMVRLLLAAIAIYLLGFNACIASSSSTDGEIHRGVRQRATRHSRLSGVSRAAQHDASSTTLKPCTPAPTDGNLLFVVVEATYERLEGRTLTSLNRSLSSVLEQTNPNWVIYLSADNYSPANVSSLFPVLSRIPPDRLSWGNLNTPGERGRLPDPVWRCAGAEALNYGLERVETRYNAVRGNSKNVIMTHLDDDDIWAPDHLAVLADTYKQFPLASFVYTRSIYQTEAFPRYDGAMAYNNYPPRPNNVIHNSVSWRLDDFFGWRYLSCNTTEWAVDADMWGRMAAFMDEQGLKSVFNPKVTTYHLTEGQG